MTTTRNRLAKEPTAKATLKPYRARVVEHQGPYATLHTHHPEEHCKVLHLVAQECRGGRPAIGTEGVVNYVASGSRAGWVFTPDGYKG